MTDFLLRDVPEDLMTALRQRAERNARSMQTEMRETLRASVRMPRDEWFAEAATLRARTKPGGETAAEAISAGRAERDAAIDRALGDDRDDPGIP